MYTEETEKNYYSIQNVNSKCRIALLKKLEGSPLSKPEETELERLQYALKNPTPLTPRSNEK